MALHWNWNEKVGEITATSRGKTFTTNLYEGNAYLIEIDEFEEDGKEMYSLVNFFADKEHAKRCLGIQKKYETYGNNMYETEYYKWDKIRLSKKYRHLKELTGMLTEAFKNITIEIYEED